MSTRTAIFKTASLIICLSLFLLHASQAQNNTEVQSISFTDNISDFLSKNDSVLNLDLGAGIADNVYLTPSNEKSDLFINIETEIELRKEHNTSAEIYGNASFERRQYLSESDASEMFIELFGEYYKHFSLWGIGISDSLSYEEYRTFDEEGGIIPAGKYESWGNKTRGFALWNIRPTQAIEAGIAYRLKKYMKEDLDFTETGIGITHTWAINAKTKTRLLIEQKSQDYDKLQTLSSDGTFSTSNPTASYDINKIRASINRKLKNFASIDFFLNKTDASENHEGEGSYDELGYGASTAFQIGNNYAVELFGSVYQRDYDKRLAGNTAAIQKDDFLTLSVTAERKFKGTLSTFTAIEHSSRDSNDPQENYSENSITFGLKGSL